MTFERVGKFLIVFFKLILGKVGVYGFTGHGGKVTSDKKMTSLIKVIRVEIEIIAAIFP